MGYNLWFQFNLFLIVPFIVDNGYDYVHHLQAIQGKDTEKTEMHEFIWYQPKNMSQHQTFLIMFCWTFTNFDEWKQLIIFSFVVFSLGFFFHFGFYKAEIELLLFSLFLFSPSPSPSHSRNVFILVCSVCALPFPSSFRCANNANIMHISGYYSKLNGNGSENEHKMI